MTANSSSDLCCQTDGKTKSKSLFHGTEPLLTYIRVAEGVLRVRQSARAALGQLVNVQAAEDDQQADQVLVHWIHLSRLFPPFLLLK